MAAYPAWVVDDFTREAFEAGYVPGPNGQMIARGADDPTADAVYRGIMSKFGDMYASVNRDDPAAVERWKEQQAAALQGWKKQFNIADTGEMPVAMDVRRQRAIRALQALRSGTGFGNTAGNGIIAGALPKDYAAFEASANDLEKYGKYIADDAEHGQAYKDFMSGGSLQNMRAQAQQYHDSDAASAWREYKSMPFNKQRSIGGYEGLISHRMGLKAAKELGSITQPLDRQVSGGTSAMAGVTSGAPAPAPAAPAPQPAAMPKLAIDPYARRRA